MANKNANAVVNATYRHGIGTWYQDTLMLYKQSIREWQTIPGYNKQKALAKAMGNVYFPPMNSYRHETFIRKVPTQMFVIETLPGYSYQQLTAYGNWSGLDFNYQTLPTSVQNTLYNKCLGKLGKRMNGNQFNVPIFLAQAKKTVSMVATSANQIAKSITTKSGKPLGKEALHNRWLEYRYGWRLLLKDCYDLLVAIHDMRKRGVMFRVEAMCEQVNKGVITRYDGAQGTIKNAPGDVVTDQTEMYEWRHQTKMTLYYSDQYGQGLQTLQQFGITNPAYVAWDLIPFSFVVDWFIPVGDYLQTLDIFVGKQFHSGCISYILQGNRTSKPINPRCAYPAWRIKQSSLPVYQASERFYKRIPLETFPTASLPDIKIDLNVNRALDAVALLRQKEENYRKRNFFGL